MRKPSKPGPRRLAGWQKALIWAAWLGVLGLLAYHSDRAVLSLDEVLAMGAALALAVGFSRHPAGAPTRRIQEGSELHGEFLVPVSWGWLVGSLLMTLGGVAMALELGRDLSTGLTSPAGVVWDMLAFMMMGSRFQDVTRQTHCYILVLLLPLGLAGLWATTAPLRQRSPRFRIGPDGLEVHQGGWQRVRWRDLAEVRCSKGVVRLGEVRLPLEGVLSLEAGSMVPRGMLEDYLRTRLEQAGMKVEKRDDGWLAS